METNGKPGWLRRDFKRKMLVIGGVLALLVTAAFVPAVAADNSPGSSGTSTPEMVGQTYQWVGVVVVGGDEGIEFGLHRRCDRWALLPQSDDAVRKLRENVGHKVIVWGEVLQGPTDHTRPTIAVHEVFGPNDPIPQTLVAVPEYPCPEKPEHPAPGHRGLPLRPGNLAARGVLVWENGTPYLATPNGRVMLTLPGANASSLRPLEEESGLRDAAHILDVVAGGNWHYEPEVLTLAARTVRPAPTPIVVEDSCTGRPIGAKLDRGEIAARGFLVREGDRLYLRSRNGLIQLSRSDVHLDEGQIPAQIEVEVVVVGQWKAGSELHIGVRRAIRLDRPCPPPSPPRPPILPGEIAALGTLIWEEGQPYLDTPAGTILLRIPADLGVPMPESQAESSPDVTDMPMMPQVIAVGKWSVEGEQLVIEVRYLRRWAGLVPVPLNGVMPSTPAPGSGSAQ
ncbi:MAG: hypothetical protein ACE5JL_06290 [Dehalococcoidia bacterium]